MKTCVSNTVEFGTVTLGVVGARLDSKETKGTVVDAPTLVIDEVVATDVAAVAVVASVVFPVAEVP